MLAILAFLILCGHVGLCVWAINRLHSCNISSWPKKLLDATWCLWFLAFPLIGVVDWYQGSRLFGFLDPLPRQSAWTAAARIYCLVCLAAFFLAILQRIRTGFIHGEDFGQGIQETRRLHIRNRCAVPPIGDLLTRLLSVVPKNEILDVDVNYKQIHLPNLPSSLEGMTILHLSDLHLTGQLGPDFYHVILEECLALRPDLIVVTGDIVESQGCLPWIPQVFGRLQAPCGVHFVLGNHEQKLGRPQPIREAFRSIGWNWLGGRWSELSWREATIHLAGTEAPWFPPHPDPAAAPRCVHRTRPLRILLSHAPDQLPRARQMAFDLVLAGHTHGGQVRFPGWGPVLSPSRFGVRYASGLFDAPPTAMHVSRGLAGTRPLRWRCPPEIALLQLGNTGCSESGPDGRLSPSRCG